jgi:hypothetical protein
MRVSMKSIRNVAVRLACVGGIAAGAGGAQALDEATNERDALKACERQMCEILVKKETTGADFACTLSKTWKRVKIQEGIEKKKLKWGFGDARCTVDVQAKRGMIVDAVSKPSHSVEFEPQTVSCQIEREKETTEVKVTLAPKISFKDGKAQKAWVNVKKIEAPAIIRGAIWTAAQVEDRFGLFHGDMIAEVNEFIDKKCPKAVTAK